MKEVGFALPVLKKGYIDLVYRSAREMKKARWKSAMDRCELTKQDEKIEELNLKVQLSADERENVARIQGQVTTKNVELTPSPVVGLRSSKTQDAKSRAHASLQSDLKALHAAGERQKDVFRDFVEKVCTCYRGLMRTHAASYRCWFDFLLPDSYLRGEYVAGCHIRFGKDGYSISIEEAASDQKPGDRLCALNSSDDGIIEVLGPIRILRLLSSSILPTLFDFLSFFFQAPFFVKFSRSTPFLRT